MESSRQYGGKGRPCKGGRNIEVESCFSIVSVLKYYKLLFNGQSHWLMSVFSLGGLEMLTEEARGQVNDTLAVARKAIENCLFIKDFCRSHSMSEKACKLLEKEKMTARRSLKRAKELSCGTEKLVAIGKEDPWYVVKELLPEKWQDKINAWTKEERETYLNGLLEEGRRKVENSQISPTGLWYLSGNSLVRFSDGWYYYGKYKMDC